MEQIVVALRNLKRKGVRSILTLVSIAIGVSSVLIIGVISDAGKAAINHELDSLGVNGISITGKQSNGNPVLQNDDLDIVRSIPDIDTAMPVVTAMGNSEGNGQSSATMIWGIDSGAGQVISLEIIYGRSFNNADIAGYGNVCLVDTLTAQSIFQRKNVIGSTISVSIGGVSEDYTIIGVAAPDSGILQSIAGEYIPAFIYVPYTTLQSALGSDALSQIAIQVSQNKTNDIDVIAKQVSQAISVLKTSDSTVNAENLAKQRGKLSNTLNIITLVLSVIGSISLIVAGLGIMTVMLVSVTERTREIGIKKAIGARKASIMREFLTEAILLSIFGCLVAMAFVWIITLAATAITGFSFSLSLAQALYAIGIAIISGIIFGVYPAYSAAKLRPVEALRRE